MVAVASKKFRRNCREVLGFSPSTISQIFFQARLGWYNMLYAGWCVLQCRPQKEQQGMATQASKVHEICTLSCTLDEKGGGDINSGNYLK